MADTATFWERCSRPRRLGDPKISTIMQVVAEEFGMTVPYMLTQRRTRELSQPRFVVSYLARQLTNQSYPAIADRMRFGDHTSVIYGEKVVRDWIIRDPLVKHRLDQLAAECRRRTR